MQRIRDSLSEEDEKRLEEAMQVVTFSSLDFAAAMRGEELDQMAALKDLNGRTAEEIIAEAGCFRHQLLLPRPYLVLTKPLRLDIQCQRAASVKIGWKYLDD